MCWRRGRHAVAHLAQQTEEEGEEGADAAVVEFDDPHIVGGIGRKVERWRGAAQIVGAKYGLIEAFVFDICSGRDEQQRSRFRRPKNFWESSRHSAFSPVNRIDMHPWLARQNSALRFVERGTKRMRLFVR